MNIEMKKSSNYFVAAAGILAGIALIAGLTRIYTAQEVSPVPLRTTPEQLAQLANYTRISVIGDFALEISQLQDYRIDYAPLDETHGELEAKVENDTLVIRGFGNRTDSGTAMVRIGIPVLDTLEVRDLPE